MNPLHKYMLAPLAKAVLKPTFLLLQRLGIHVVPNQFYFPVPDTSKLPDSLWTTESAMVGIDIDDDRQIKTLSICSLYQSEYNKFPLIAADAAAGYYVHNPYFGPVDGEVLYGMVRFFRPKRILEIGSGFSTLLSAKAILSNRADDAEYHCLLMVVDPFPSSLLCKRFFSFLEVRRIEAQALRFEDVDELEADDILFIDSSHVLKTGSDVQWLYLELLPRVKPGVLVHIHDVFLPMEYPKDYVKERFRFWNEQYLLQAFLTFNKEFEVLWAGNYMKLKHPDKLAEVFSSYDSLATPVSFWLRRCSS